MTKPKDDRQKGETDDKPKKLDLLQFLIDNNVKISFSNTCRTCGFDYTSIRHDQWHNCKEQRVDDIVFPQSLVDKVRPEAEKLADEVIRSYKTVRRITKLDGTPIDE